jgi:hypothetical protein
MLWMVTAIASLELRESALEGPSDSLLCRCWWGVHLSSINRKTTPNMKPTAAGTTAMAPSPESSIEGISNDHTDAAVITPAAKPTKAFSRYNGICRRMK